MKLLFQAIIKFVLGVLMIGILLFLPAGTFYYWNAWLLMGLLFIPMFILGFIIAGLDFRYGWSNMPTSVIAIASVILVISYALYAEVRSNKYDNINRMYSFMRIVYFHGICNVKKSNSNIV